MDLEHCHAVLERAGVKFDSGMTAVELEAAEARFAFTFPPDLRAFLAFALPTGGSAPTWRDLENPGLIRTMGWPLEGMCFDIENNVFWPDEWGERPVELAEAFEIARGHVALAPKLIPVFGHRYLPDRPATAGNPVFSVYQTTSSITARISRITSTTRSTTTSERQSTRCGPTFETSSSGRGSST